MGQLFSAVLGTGSGGGRGTRRPPPPPLFEAIADGDVDAAREELRNGANINMRSRRGSTPLYRACKRGHTDMVALLVDRGGIIDKVHWLSAMFDAVSSNSTPIVRMLFASGISIFETDESPTAAMNRFLGKGMRRDALLRIAIENKNEEMVKLLVAQGACIHVTDKKGKTPIDIARNHSIIRSYLRTAVPRCNHSLGFALVVTVVVFALNFLHALYVAIGDM